jgi:aminoglycoside phosphotransferase (APT) family kinase protein
VSAELIDHDRLVAWLDEQGLEPGAPLVTEQISGGASNVMFRLERGGSRWVLRRPARVAMERADQGMRREFRLLGAFEGTPVPHPAPVALCDDHAVLGCTFYLMGLVDGINPLPVPPWLDELTFALTDALARMHEVDPVAAGIADLGRPEGFHERQVSRWTRQLESYEGRELPGLDRVTAWLDANQPGAFVPTIMHGDYHMMNVMIAPDAPARVVAIVDWETATIGDPLLDLAGFYEIWTLSTGDGDGWPTSEEIAARYAQARGIADLGDLTYYAVLYNFRLAVLLEGIYQRSIQDPTRPDAVGVGDRVLFNVGRAVELVDGNG